MAKFLVCYDLSEEKKRGKVRKELKNRGLHLQWSVFEVETDNAERIREFLLSKVQVSDFESLMVFRLKKLLARIGSDWDVPQFRI